MSADEPVVAEVVPWGPGHPKWRPPTPYEVGNEAALKHGAWSPRRVDPLALEIIAAVRPSVSWWTVADEPAVHAWGRAEAQTQLVSEYLARAGEVSGDGVGDLDDEAVKSAYLLLHRVETRANTLRNQLGLTPLARAKLSKDVAAGAVDMARLMADELARESEGGEG